MTTKELKKLEELNTLKRQIKKEGYVSEAFRRELEQLIKLAGFDKNIDADLREFAFLDILGEGISNTKIKWILELHRKPNCDFLYSLAKIAVKVRGVNYYKKLKIDNPLKYEYERFLELCDYDFTIGNIWPREEKNRYIIRRIDFETEAYLSSVPNIFWDYDIDFESVVDFFHRFVKYSNQLIHLDEHTFMTYGLYNCEDDRHEKMTAVSIEEEYCPIPDVVRFRIDNTNEKLRFKSIEVTRSREIVVILIELINGNWMELISPKLKHAEGWGQDLDINNFYNSANTWFADRFCYQVPKTEEKEWKDILTMDKLYSKLATNHNYKDAHARLTLTKDTD